MSRVFVCSSFNYEALKKKFNKVLEFRPINYKEYPVFAILFIETEESSKELEMVLKMDVGEYIEWDRKGKERESETAVGEVQERGESAGKGKERKGRGRQRWERCRRGGRVL